MKTLFIFIGILIFSLGNAQIPTDKQYHLGAGIAIGAWTTWAVSTDQKPILNCALYGIGISTAIGAIKEGADLCGYGTPEWADLGYTVAGGVIGTAITCTLVSIFRERKIRLSVDVSEKYVTGGLIIKL
jgi:hypothetical protein